MNVPIMLPRFAIAITIRTLINLFLKKSLMVSMVRSILMSLTVGVRNLISTYPATQPAPIVGFRDVNGAATNAVRIVNGWPNAIAAPIAEQIPLIRNHKRITCINVSHLEKYIK